MMQQLQIFNHVEFGQARFLEFEGKPFAVGVDIAKILEYANPSKAVIQHCKGVTKMGIPSSGGMQETNIIPEGDIYRLIMKAADQSKNLIIKEKAVEFEKWVFDTILPTIRKTGGFVANDDLFINTYFPNADDATKMFMKTNLETIRKQNETIAIKDKEIDHKTGVIHGLVDEITLADKRQILNEVMRKSGNKFQDRWNKLYAHFEKKYHINLKRQMVIYNESHKPKMKNKLDYVENVLGKLPELYEVAVKLFENDIQKLVQELYELNDIRTTA